MSTQNTFEATIQAHNDTVSSDRKSRTLAGAGGGALAGLGGAALARAATGRALHPGAAAAMAGGGALIGGLAGHTSGVSRAHDRIYHFMNEERKHERNQAAMDARHDARAAAKTKTAFAGFGRQAPAPTFDEAKAADVHKQRVLQNLQKYGPRIAVGQSFLTQEEDDEESVSGGPAPTPMTAQAAHAWVAKHGLPVGTPSEPEEKDFHRWRAAAGLPAVKYPYADAKTAMWLGFFDEIEKSAGVLGSIGGAVMGLGRRAAVATGQQAGYTGLLRKGIQASGGAANLKRNVGLGTAAVGTFGAGAMMGSGPRQTGVVR